MINNGGSIEHDLRNDRETKEQDTHTYRVTLFRARVQTTIAAVHGH